MILSLVQIVLSTDAQSIIQKVNDIKKMSDEYIYSQYAHLSPDTALVNAAEWLSYRVESISGQEVNGKDIMPYIKHIFLKGKSITRAFVYMKISDVQSAVDEIIAKRKREASESFVPDSLALSIIGKKDLYAVYSYLEHCVHTGAVIQYGSPKDVDDIDSKYIVLFKKENLVPVFVLSHVLDDDLRINLINGEQDSLDNYHGYYAIWYIPEEK